MKFKSILCSAAVLLITAISLYGQDISIRYWAAADSTFSELPAEGTGKVYGDFETSFITLRSEFYISPLFDGNFNISYGIIAENIMNIAHEMTAIRFDGSAWNIKANIAYSLVEDEGSFIDAEAGFYYAKGTKKFYDRTVNGIVENTGQWGEYRISYYGPQIGVHGNQTLFSPIALDAVFIWRPVLFSATEVTGLSDETTDGYGFEYSVAVYADIAKQVSLFGGYGYEKIYFNPTDISYDLTIEYAGFLFGVGMTF